MKPSSADLHPKTGARFVFERREDVYEVEVHLADGTSLRTTLRFGAEGGSSLEPTIDVDWAGAEVHKLARVLKREPKDRLVRWRPQPTKNP